MARQKLLKPAVRILSRLRFSVGLYNPAAVLPGFFLLPEIGAISIEPRFHFEEHTCTDRCT